MIKNPLIYLQRITDPAILRANFESLTRYFDSNGQFDGFRCVEFEVTQNVANGKISHKLGFIPKDVIITSLIAPSGAKLVLNHGLFSTSEIDITVSGLTAGQTLKCRLFLGTNKSCTPQLSIAETDTQEFKSKL